mmetsp:Transcript_13511/g.17005  ORF Transcript_13511/g.17005 Transcript_13511/m.17005 type:complete len:124 (+) Transcript_13511:137-508(+)
MTTRVWCPTRPTNILPTVLSQSLLQGGVVCLSQVKISTGRGSISKMRFTKDNATKLTEKRQFPFRWPLTSRSTQPRNYQYRPLDKVSFHGPGECGAGEQPAAKSKARVCFLLHQMIAQYWWLR